MAASAKIRISSLSLLAGIVYFFSNPRPSFYYDYTFRVAENFLQGSIGFTAKQPSWLNELVPYAGVHYSVFPLGSVLTMLPFALLKVIGLVGQMPAAFIASLTAALVFAFLLFIAERYEISPGKRILVAAGLLFGTWMWTNLTFAGAWQLALGFAMLGELGAIYFTVFNRKPLIAGLFFAFAFGNRTEILLTAPIFLYLLNRSDAVETSASRKLKFDLSATILFCCGPFILGVATLFYNYIRFGSPTDFGYARIPGVLNEPWYQHGIFSVRYIPRQIWEMLLRLWEFRETFPYLTPNPFSSSILLSSPFLLFAFRSGFRDRILKYLSWAAVAVLSIILWMHGNSGGWQFGYRYAMVLLPWLFIILLENSRKEISKPEMAIYIFSIIANAYSVWLFHWTQYLKP